MKLTECITAIEKVDKLGIWALPLFNLRVIFSENPKAFMKGLARMEALGVLLKVARGLYVNPKSRCLPQDTLAALVPFLKPWDFNYLSLESVLSEAGWISQMPSRLTLMTTGRKGIFNTPYGTIEFVHTERKPNDNLSELYLDPVRELYVASPQLALRDLKRVGRNVDLVIPEAERNGD
jgi:hypothetical protein